MRGGQNLIDLTGQRFGRWSVLALHPERSGCGRARWCCRCICGTERIVDGNNLRSGRSTSCRCVQREMRKKHGQSNTNIYQRWVQMRARCLNERHAAYPNYGGRGITIHEDWREDFSAFYADVGNPPPGLSLDRIDNDGNYEAGNWRWATPTVQSINRRRSRRRSRRRDR